MTGGGGGKPAGPWRGQGCTGRVTQVDATHTRVRLKGGNSCRAESQGDFSGQTDRCGEAVVPADHRHELRLRQAGASRTDWPQEHCEPPGAHPYSGGLVMRQEPTRVWHRYFLSPTAPTEE
ncbi:hypothetical protein GCM10023220_68180 [Streptomyces ziwulingensis]|uniref:Uncharacterized protein n=1 Tax=Streptomyces ziwulingensis TaxID=1045501 RepID=A0ABP9D1S3_9ACTN